VKVIAVALTAVAGLMDERTDNMDAEPANAPLFRGLLQIRPAESERIEWLAIVDKGYPEPPRPPPERHGDGSSRRTWPETMRYRIGEELIENNQKPRPLVIRQTALMREPIGKGLEPGELRVLGTQRDRGSLHRRLLISLPTGCRSRVSKETLTIREKQLPGRKKLALALWLAAGLLIATAGVPAATEAPPIVQKPIAQIKKVTGQASVLRAGERRPAIVGDMLFVNDVIETGSDGGIGITFIDNTVFSAGPSSQIALDEFQFDSNDFRGAMLADMRRGTLAVVSGDIARSTPGAMKIKTPTAILGVRGTTFAVQVYGEH
jgi:hypothetical protein